jgi:hypothetical protein
MTTAIIVSGVMRNMINASSSWTIPGDYFLHIDNRIVEPQSNTINDTAINQLESNIKNSAIKFVNIIVDTDESAKFTLQQLNEFPELKDHPNVNMAWRWKCAYNQLKSFDGIKNYDKVLLIRPDMFLFIFAPLFEFENLVADNNTIYSTRGLFTDPVKNYQILGDAFLMCNMQTLSVFSKFFDYYVANYKSTRGEFPNGNHDIHSLLAKFVLENNMSVNTRLGELIDFAVLRDNSNYMFEHGKLKKEFGFYDLKLRQEEWWRERWQIN